MGTENKDRASLTYALIHQKSVALPGGEGEYQRDLKNFVEKFRYFQGLY